MECKFVCVTLLGADHWFLDTVVRSSMWPAGGSMNLCVLFCHPIIDHFFGQARLDSRMRTPEITDISRGVPRKGSDLRTRAPVDLSGGCVHVLSFGVPPQVQPQAASQDVTIGIFHICRRCLHAVCSVVSRFRRPPPGLRLITWHVAVRT